MHATLSTSVKSGISSIFWHWILSVVTKETTESLSVALFASNWFCWRRLSDIQVRESHQLDLFFLILEDISAFIRKKSSVDAASIQIFEGLIVLDLCVEEGEQWMRRILLQGDKLIYALEQWSPTFFVPGTSFTQKHFFKDLVRVWRLILRELACIADAG